MSPADFVNGEFQAELLNQFWVANITYVKTHVEWVYTVYVEDLFSRMVVSWQIAAHLIH